jgi:hypothetical protein
MEELKNCPFCGTAPQRCVDHEILHVECPNCVSVGFHNHVRLGCRADSEWNSRVDEPLIPHKEAVFHLDLFAEILGVDIPTDPAWVPHFFAQLKESIRNNQKQALLYKTVADTLKMVVNGR